jgi:hypothetical protein
MVIDRKEQAGRGRVWLETDPIPTWVAGTAQEFIWRLSC